MRVAEQLKREAAPSWRRVQHIKEWFIDDLDQIQRQHHQQFLEALMLYERECFLQAHPYQRCAQRVDQANGFYQRRLVTRLGVVDLAAPRTRSGQFRTQLLRRYGRRQAAVDQALRQVFLLGVSTRQTGAAVATLVEDAVSATTVSQIGKLLNPLVERWHRRALVDTYRYLILDGVSVRIRLVGQVQRRVALCAYGMKADGKRELIDFLLVKTESQDSWRSFLEELWKRGLRGQKLALITTDGQEGLMAALKLVWPRVAHQRCWAHKLRNLASKLKRRQQACLWEAKLIYQQTNRARAIQRFRWWRDRWKAQAPKAIACVEQDLEELLAFYACAPAHWKRVRTTNVIERLFVEVRRRIRTMCAFTTRDSCERIVFSVFDRMNQYWAIRPLKTFTHNY